MSKLHFTFPFHSTSYHFISNTTDLTDAPSNDTQQPVATNLSGLHEFGQYNNVYYNHPRPSSSPAVPSDTITKTNINTKPLINKDGSLPVNSPTQYIVHVYDLAEKELENQIKTDGFYRNLIFAEHLFSRDNDELAINNAVINVNVYTRQHTKDANDDDGDDEEAAHPPPPGVFVEHVKPGKIEITIDNEYPVETLAKKNEKINDGNDKTTTTTTTKAKTTEIPKKS